MFKYKRLALAAGLVLASPMSPAAVSDADVQALKDSIAVLTEKLDALEQELDAEKARTAQQATTAAAPAPVPEKSPASWAEKIAIKGDLRGRYENIDVEGSDDRNRNRIRARAAIVAQPQQGLEVGFGLSTGQDGDPVSSNQTIGNGGSRKDVYIDLAYFNWQAAEGLNAIGGKFKNNLYRPGGHGLTWDSDFNPEGLALTYANGAFFANAMGTWVESDSASSSRSEAIGIGGQVGVVWPLDDAVTLTAGTGYFTINTEGKGPFFDDGLFGNTGAGGRYVFDYNDIQGFAELGFELFGQPAMLFADYVKNTDADDFDTGWATGAQLGRAKARGTWELFYAYQDLEADAVFGLWTDSDFGGGGTDNKGHVLRGTYALSDKTNMAFSYFMNEIDENIGAEKDYDRLQLDLNFKY
jgi:hypothetical protein